MQDINAFRNFTFFLYARQEFLTPFMLRWCKKGEMRRSEMGGEEEAPFRKLKSLSLSLSLLQPRRRLLVDYGTRSRAPAMEEGRIFHA